MSKEETLTIKYTGNKEHIQAIRDMVKKHGGSLEDWLHFVIICYMEEWGLPRKVKIPTKLFHMLAEEALRRKQSVDELLTEILYNTDKI